MTGFATTWTHIVITQNKYLLFYRATVRTASIGYVDRTGAVRLTQSLSLTPNCTQLVSTGNFLAFYRPNRRETRRGDRAAARVPRDRAVRFGASFLE